MRKVMSFSFFISLVSVVLLIMTEGTAHSDDKEIRLYSEIEETASQKNGDNLSFTLKPFLREESRFREGRFVYQQWNAGLRFQNKPWFSSQIYYTPRDQMYEGTPYKHKDVMGGDILFFLKIRSLRILNREANEWHMTDNFYRYRNFTNIIYITKIKWLAPYVYDEFRVDNDQKRMNVNDLGVGIQITPSSLLTMQIFYDHESNHRNISDWEYVRYFGLSFIAHL
jgi:hypothetical protein